MQNEPTTLSVVSLKKQKKKNSKSIYIMRGDKRQRGVVLATCLCTTCPLIFVQKDWPLISMSASTLRSVRACCPPKQTLLVQCSKDKEPLHARTRGVFVHLHLHFGQNSSLNAIQEKSRTPNFFNAYNNQNICLFFSKQFPNR